MDFRGFFGQQVRRPRLGEGETQEQIGRAVLAALGREVRADARAFPDWVEQEQRATDIRTYDMGLIPGLLQTPDYQLTHLLTLPPNVGVQIVPSTVRIHSGKAGQLTLLRFGDTAEVLAGRGIGRRLPGSAIR